MGNKKENSEKKKGNLLELTVKDISKIQGGYRGERLAKRHERRNK